MPQICNKFGDLITYKLDKAALFSTKLLSVYPQNRQQRNPTINSVYILNNAVGGRDEEAAQAFSREAAQNWKFRSR